MSKFYHKTEMTLDTPLNTGIFYVAAFGKVMYNLDMNKV